MLPDGFYVTEYDKEFKMYPPYEFEIKGEKYYTFTNGEKEEYDIIKMNCNYRLESSTTIDESKLTDLQKMLANQKPFFNIDSAEGNRYHFTLRINLHIVSFSGTFIKKE
jgi:hypothetical protein